MRKFLAILFILCLVADVDARGCRSCGRGRMAQRSGKMTQRTEAVAKTKVRATGCAGGKCAVK
jgi:hypothetical protein